MVTPNERTVLEIAAENLGGRVTYTKLRNRMGLCAEILTVTCKSLESRGYLRLPAAGIVTLTSKGLQVGERAVEQKLMKEAEEKLRKEAEEKLMKAKKISDEQAMRQVRKEKRKWTQMPLVKQEDKGW